MMTVHSITSDNSIIIILSALVNKLLFRKKVGYFKSLAFNLSASFSRSFHFYFL